MFSRALSRCTGWFFRPVALGRVAVLRTIAYLFVCVDWLIDATWVMAHKDVPGELYMPLTVAKILPLPVPTPTIVMGTFVIMIAAALPAAFNVAPRLLGTIVFVAYFEWMIIAMSYGKVDHDKFGFLILLAVLPTVGPARWGDKRRLSEAAGWAINLTQIGVIATYFLAAFAKFRFGGFEWVNSATLTRAVVRRGTVFSEWLLDYPWILHLTQWGIISFELGSIVVFFVASQRLRNWIISGFYLFHLVTFASLTIIFLPHLLAMLSFFELEKIPPPREWRRRLRTRWRSRKGNEPEVAAPVSRAAEKDAVVREA